MSSRRDFVKKTALIGTGLALAPGLSFGSTLNYYKDHLKIGLIGVGLRGTNHLNNLLLRDDVAITAICDIDERRNTIALDMIAKAGYNKPKVFAEDEYDYQNLLELPEVDAVIIATPGYGIPVWPRMPCLPENTPGWKFQQQIRWKNAGTS